MAYSLGGFAFSSALRAQASPSCKSFAFSASLTRRVCFSVRPAPEPAGRPLDRFVGSSMPAFYARQKVLAKSYLMSDTKCTDKRKGAADMNTANPVVAANASAIAAGFSVSEITKRCLSAIDECDHFISKEEPRSADLRPASVQKILNRYKAHRLNLIAAIEELSK